MKFFYSFEIVFLVFALVLIFSLCFFIPVFFEYGSVDVYNPNTANLSLEISNSGLLWPTPGFTTITSSFGYRKSPTAGASSYHSGIDIGAPQRYKYNCL